MVNMIIKKKVRATPKIKYVSVRLPEELYKRIKSHIPKDKSITLHSLILSVLDNTFNDQLKIKVQEVIESDDKRGAHNDKS